MIALWLAAIVAQTPVTKATTTTTATARARSDVLVLVSLRRCCADEAWVVAEQATVAELQSLGFSVEVVDGVGVDERARRLELTRVAVERDAACALRLVRPAGGGVQSPVDVEIWIEDRVTGKRMSRTLNLAAGTDGAGLVALRVSEALRASLLEARLPANETTPATLSPAIASLTKVPVAVGPVDPAEVSPFTIGLMIGETIAPGGVGPLGVVGLEGRWTSVGGLAIGANLRTTALSATVDRGGLTSTFQFVAAQAVVGFEPRTLLPLRFFGGASASVVAPWAVGLADASFQPQTDVTAIGSIGVVGRLGLDLTEHLTLWAGVDGDVLLPGVEIRYGNEVAARWGAPAATVSLRIDLRP